MKRIKLVSSILFFCVIFTSCSNDNENLIEKEIQGITIHNEQYFPIDDDLSKSDSDLVKVSKYVDGEFKYNLAIADNFIFKSANTTSKNVDNIRVENTTTGEYIDIINIEEQNGYRTFDAVNNLGSIVNGFSMEITEEEVFSKKNPWVYVVPVIVGALLDLLSDSPLEQCTNAMQNLDCQNGTNPFMNFSEGGWFSSTTCSVGCN